MLTILVLLLAGAQVMTGQSQTAEGLWLGTLDAGAMKLRIAFHLSKSPAGTLSGNLTGTFDSLDQGASGLPISSGSQKNGSVSLEMAKLHASYEGTLSADGMEMSGAFKQGGATLPLNLRKTEKLPDTSRPQEPKKPYPYREEDVTYPNAKARVQLAGTLTLPPGNGPFPAVLLITGSGPQDRDEAMMGHRPFLVIADHLTRQGIAVLRVDDRGIGKSTGSFALATTADFADDADAGVQFLKARKEINPGRIGLIGHSEGAIIAPMIAARSHDVAFIVLMAGTAVPGDQVSLFQQRAINKSSGMPDAIVAQNEAIQNKLAAIVKQEDDLKVTDSRVRALLQESGMPEAAIDMKTQTVLSPWLRFFWKYDPAPALRKTKQPVLAMNGALDTQVSPRQNLPLIVQALEDGGNGDYEIVTFPNLNHLFQTAKTGAVSEYSTISETIAPAALDVMTAWILRHAR
ncbi:MAG: alpha/beta fold hydrolase [Acidobacteriota bacterium]|nr:alpha/beta fold hydrolase [Acidobacteriota bacterium]